MFDIVLRVVIAFALLSAGLQLFAFLGVLVLNVVGLIAGVGRYKRRGK